jgi:hypothetical protein
MGAGNGAWVADLNCNGPTFHGGSIVNSSNGLHLQGVGRATIIGTHFEHASSSGGTQLQISGFNKGPTLIHTSSFNTKGRGLEIGSKGSDLQLRRIFVNTVFKSGEEDVYIHDDIKRGGGPFIFYPYPFHQNGDLTIVDDRTEGDSIGNGVEIIPTVDASMGEYFRPYN